MTTECADVARALGIFISSDPMPQNKLSISHTENTVCTFNSAGLMDSLKEDTVLAPLSLGATDVTLMPTKVCVGMEGPAIFVLASKGSTPLHEGVLKALAAGTEVLASLLVAGLNGGECAVLAPADIEASVDGVLLIVPFLAGTPQGSRVVINRVWVAGCEVALDELSSSITIGFNHHTPAPAGAMIAAAKAGDLSGVRAALDNGESTEQKDAVSSDCRELIVVLGCGVSRAISPLPLRIAPRTIQ